MYIYKGDGGHSAVCAIRENRAGIERPQLQRMLVVVQRKQIQLEEDEEHIGVQPETARAH
jgi:hypothetical protein